MAHKEWHSKQEVIQELSYHQSNNEKYMDINIKQKSQRWSYSTPCLAVKGNPSLIRTDETLCNLNLLNYYQYWQVKLTNREVVQLLDRETCPLIK